MQERRITLELLELTENFKNTTNDFADDPYKSFGKNSTIAFVLYDIVILTTVLLPIFSIYSKTLGLSIVIIKLAAYIAYFVFLIKSFINQNQFYKAIVKDYGTNGALVYLFLAMPFYAIMNFYFRNQVKGKMTELK